MSTKFKTNYQEQPNGHKPYYSNHSSKKQSSQDMEYVPKKKQPEAPKSREETKSDNSTHLNQPVTSNSFFDRGDMANSSVPKDDHHPSQKHSKGPKYPKGNNKTNKNGAMEPLISENGLKTILGVQGQPNLSNINFSENSLKDSLGLKSRTPDEKYVAVHQKIEVAQVDNKGYVESTSTVSEKSGNMSLDNWANTLTSQLNIPKDSEIFNSQPLPEIEVIQGFIQESLDTPFPTCDEPLEEIKFEIGNENNQKDKFKLYICQDFHKIYRFKRVFGKLFKTLLAVWNDGESTLEEPEEVCNWIKRCNMDAIKSNTIFFSLLFHVLVEKEHYALALDVYNENKKILVTEATFGDLLQKSVKVLEAEGFKCSKLKRRNNNLRGILPGRVDIDDLDLHPQSIHLIDRFERNGKRLRVPAFEKIGTADRISIHYEMNKYDRNYMSVLSIATKDEVILIDLERLCKYEEILLIIIEFFEVLLSKRSTVVIMLNAEEFIQKFIESLSIENEYKLKEIVQAKMKLCQALQKNRYHYTDLSLFGAESTSEMAMKLFGKKIDQREKYGNWYKRPLADDQIKLASIDARLLFVYFEKLVCEES